MKKFKVTLFYHLNPVASRWIDGSGAKDVKEKAIKRNPTWKSKLLKSKHYWIGVKLVGRATK